MSPVNVNLSIFTRNDSHQPYPCPNQHSWQQTASSTMNSSPTLPVTCTSATRTQHRALHDPPSRSSPRLPPLGQELTFSISDSSLDTPSTTQAAQTLLCNLLTRTTLLNAIPVRSRSLKTMTSKSRLTIQMSFPSFRTCAPLRQLHRRGNLAL